MTPVIIIGVVVLVAIIGYLLLNRDNICIENNEETEEKIDYKEIYTKEWLFTYNEKDAYRELKKIADEMGYTIFTKVRILDLIKPIKGIEKYQTYFNKIKSKHVDFVLCNEKLVVEYIIELDDSTHERPDRKERDKFVDEALGAVGYKVIHVYKIDESLKDKLK